MSPFRGVVMIAAAGVAFYLGWKRLAGREAFVAFSLGAAALGLGVWHLDARTAHVNSNSTSQTGGALRACRVSTTGFRAGTWNGWRR